MASKYTDEQLRAMALETLAARGRNDERYLQLIMTVSLTTGLTPVQVEQKIENIVRGEFA